MASITYITDPDTQQALVIPNVVTDHDGTAYTLTSDNVTDHDGIPYPVFFTSAVVPPLIPETEEEFARVRAAGRYFETPETPRVFKTPDTPRTFYT